MGTNILFTSSGGMHAQRLFFLIKKKNLYKDIKIHAVNHHPLKAKQKTFHDSFTKIPNSENKYFLKSIKKIIKKKNIDIVIPGSDEEALKLSKNKDKLKTFISCPNKNKIKFINDKFQVLSKLKKEKIFNIDFFKINSFKNLQSKILVYKKKNADFVIKPIFSRGGRDVLTINKYQNKNLLFFNKKREITVKRSFFYRNQDKLLSKYKKKLPLIFMDKLFQPNLDIDILSWNGKLIKYVIRQRIGFQAQRGSIILKQNNKIKKILKKISKIFNLTGIYDCDFMFDKNKQPTLLELNPRISGSLYSSIFAGANLIEDLILLKEKQNKKIKNFNIQYKQKVLSKNILK